MTSGPNTAFRLSDKPGSLGVSCDENGVTLAGIPLLRLTGHGFMPRPPAEIQRLLGRGYQLDAELTSVTEGLGVVARALNAGDTARAKIAAVELKLPELDWHGAVRIADADGRLADLPPPARRRDSRRAPCFRRAASHGAGAVRC